jgi:hypothetical protein
MEKTSFPSSSKDVLERMERMKLRFWTQHQLRWSIEMLTRTDPVLYKKEIGLLNQRFWDY